MFVRRDRRGADRYAPLRIGLIFLAAGAWLAGLVSGRQWLTGAAIGILLLALLLQVLGRRVEGE